MKYELELIGDRRVRMLVWQDGNVVDEMTIDASEPGALRDLMSIPELYFAAEAKVPFKATLARMRRDVAAERESGDSLRG